MNAGFDDAFRILIGHEGGYVNDRNDPGGETKFGISKRSYPREDIANLTLERAKAIYLRDFWQKARCHELPDVVAFALFDAAVNSGVSMGVKLLQRALRVTDDGRFGPVTMAAAKAANPAALAARLNGHRLIYMTNLKTWPHFGKGWARRIAGNIAELPL
jgi:lysozyme family protein